MNFRRIVADLNALYDGQMRGDDKGGYIEKYEPMPGDEWVLQRNYPDGDAYKYSDEVEPWWNGEPRKEMMDYIEVLALAVVGAGHGRLNRSV